MLHLCQFWFSKLLIEWCSIWFVELFSNKVGVGDSTGPTSGARSKKVWELLSRRFEFTGIIFCQGTQTGEFCELHLQAVQRSRICATAWKNCAKSLQFKITRKYTLIIANQWLHCCFADQENCFTLRSLIEFRKISCNVAKPIAIALSLWNLFINLCQLSLASHFTYAKLQHRKKRTR